MENKELTLKYVGLTEETPKTHLLFYIVNGHNLDISEFSIQLGIRINSVINGDNKFRDLDKIQTMLAHEVLVGNNVAYVSDLTTKDFEVIITSALATNETQIIPVVVNKDELGLKAAVGTALKPKTVNGSMDKTIQDLLNDYTVLFDSVMSPKNDKKEIVK